MAKEAKAARRHLEVEELLEDQKRNNLKLTERLVKLENNVGNKPPTTSYAEQAAEAKELSDQMLKIPGGARPHAERCSTN